MTNEYKIKAVKGFSKLKLGEWYNISTRDDHKDLLTVIRWLMSHGINYEVSEDEKMVKLLNNYYMMVPVEQGFTESTIGHKGKVEQVTHSADNYGRYKPSWRVYKGEKLIAIEV